MAILKRRLNDISPNDNPQDEPPPKTAKTTHTRNHRIQECTICASDLPLKSFPPKLGHRTLNTRHSTCSACWQQHLATQITADKPTSQITCPQCPYVLREADIKALGSAETHAAYLDKMFQEAMQADPGYRSCPSATCSFGYILTQDDEQSDSIFNCRVCQAQYCVRCEVPMHRGQTCEAYQAETNGRNVNEDEEASRVFLEEYAKVCPKCGVRIRKNGGCDHMTCRKCKHEFCWLCFAAYKGPRGIHTIGNGAHEGTCRYHPDILHRTSPPHITFPQPNRPTPIAPAQANRPRRGRPARGRLGGRVSEVMGAARSQAQQQVRDVPQAVVVEEEMPGEENDRSALGALRAVPRARQNQPPVQNNRPARMRLDDDSRDELRAARRSLEGPQPAQNNRPTRLFAAHDSGDETDWGALARAISPAPQHAEPPEAAQGLGITGLDGDDYDGDDIIDLGEDDDNDIIVPATGASVAPEPQAQTPRAASPAASDASTDSNIVVAPRDTATPEFQARPRSPTFSPTSDRGWRIVEVTPSPSPSPEPQQPRPSSLSPMLSSPELSPLGRPPPRRRAASPRRQSPPGRRNAVAPQHRLLSSGETSLQRQNDSPSPRITLASLLRDQSTTPDPPPERTTLGSFLRNRSNSPDSDSSSDTPPPPRNRSSRRNAVAPQSNPLFSGETSPQRPRPWASFLRPEARTTPRSPSPLFVGQDEDEEQPVMERNLSTRFRDIVEERLMYEIDEEGFVMAYPRGSPETMDDDTGEEVVLDG